MSNVTNIILCFDIMESVEERLNDVNQYFLGTSRHDGFIYDTWDRGVGGSKCLEHPTFLGAFNHLDIPAFLTHVGHVTWEYRRHVQVLLCEQHDDVYSCYCYQ